MLNDNSFRSFAAEGASSRVKKQTLSFLRSQPLWNKSKGSTKQNSEPLCQINSKQRYKFYKTGKTFGFETSRYVQYHNGVLYYFENQKDDKCKGYCNLQNVYIKHSKIQSGFELYLTNGKASSSLIFSKNQFYSMFQQSMAKYVIQLNFKEKYFIADLIGTGTFAKVYSAIHIASKVKFAVKIMPKIDQNGFQTKHIVEQQKRILKNLNSKNICKMEEFFEDSQSYIFVLQYLEGKDLNIILKQSTRQIPLEQKISIMKSALHGLVDLHKKNIIHRDLKPHNIVVNLHNSSTKIVDFGLSLLCDNKTQIDKFIRCGTMGFIAPEVVNNSETSRKSYCCKSDMFGFGIVTHMLLLGSNPLRGKTYKETTERNLKGQVSLNQKQIIEAYGTECLHFLENLLRKDPKKRWSAQEALNSQFIANSHKNEGSQASIRFCDDPRHEEHDEINHIGGKEFGGNIKNQKWQFSGKKQKSLSTTPSKFYGLF